ERRGPAYAQYLAVTSMLPFAAIVEGRQRLVWGELPIRAFAIGIVVAWALRWVHPSIFAGGGRWIIVATVAGGALASLQSWLRVRRGRVHADVVTVRG